MIFAISAYGLCTLWVDLLDFAFALTAINRDQPLLWLFGCPASVPSVVLELRGQRSVPVSDLRPWLRAGASSHTAIAVLQ